MKTDKSNDKSFEESSEKKLDSIIKKRKAENEALRKILVGLEKLSEKTEDDKKKIVTKKKK